jgi:hypothetical protein
MSTRRPLYALLVTGTAAGLVLSAATPGSAGGAQSKNYKTSGTSTGDVETATRLGSLTLTDHSDGHDRDRITGNASRGEIVKIQARDCKATSIAFFGLAPAPAFDGDWANVASGVEQKGRMRLDCTYFDGTKHRFHWGMTTLTTNPALDPTRTNCLSLVRSAQSSTTTTTYTVTASGDSCPVQREVLHSDWTVSDRVSLDISFKATFIVSGAVPVVG